MRYILIFLTLFYLFHNALKPDWVRINEAELKACTVAQQANPDFVCD